MQRYDELQYKVGLYLDLELTCWDTVPPPGMKPDIIEVGVVMMDLTSLRIIDEASYFVRPRLWEVSTVCTQLTGITDAEIRAAPRLVEVLASIGARFAPDDKPCYAWGDDVSVLSKTAKAYGLQSPLRRAVDLSAVYHGVFATKDRVGLSKAVEMLGLAFDGVAHGALPDARNTAHVHATLLRRLRQQAEALPTSPRVHHENKPLSPFAEKLSASLSKP